MVTRGTGELNYHIFYAIIAATDPARKQVRTCPCVFASRAFIACLDRYTCMDGRICRHACVLSVGGVGFDWLDLIGWGAGALTHCAVSTSIPPIDLD